MLTVESASLLIIGNLQIFTFLESLTKLPCFIDGRDYKVDRRHAYQVDEKKMVWFQLGIKENEWFENGHLHPIFSKPFWDNFQAHALIIFSPSHIPVPSKHMHTIKLGMLELLDLHLMLPKLLQKKALMKLNRYQWDIATCLFTWKFIDFWQILKDGTIGRTLHYDFTHLSANPWGWHPTHPFLAT